MLRSCFYILLQSHGHKSPGRKQQQQHLLCSLHLSLAASPQAPGHSRSGLFISSQWELLIPLVSLILCLSFGFCTITITHPGPLHLIVLYWPPGPPDPLIHGCEFGSLFSELSEDEAILIFLRHSKLPTERIICIISFLSSFDLFLSSCALDMGRGFDLISCQLFMY